MAGCGVREGATLCCRASTHPRVAGASKIGLAALCCLLGAAPVAAAEDAITPSFAWPVRTEAKVSMTLHTTDQAFGSDRVRTYDLSATYDMCALKDPADHVRVRFANLGFVLPAGDVKETFDVYNRIPVLPVAFAPTLVVDRDATFLRVEDGDDLRAALTALVEDRVKDMPGGAADEGLIQKQVRQGGSDAALAREASDWWNSSVGLWNGRALRRGEPVRWTAVQPLSVAGGTTIEVARQFRFEFVGRARCAENETDERCVELTVTSEVAAEDFKRAADRLHDLLGGDMRVELPENGNDARLVTDPATLLPYRVHRSRRYSMIVKYGEQQVMGGRRQDEIDMAFAYPAAPTGACDKGQ